MQVFFSFFIFLFMSLSAARLSSSHMVLFPKHLVTLVLLQKVKTATDQEGM